MPRPARNPQISHANSGQGLVEYVLLLSLALFTAIGFAKGLSRAVDSGVVLFGGQLEKDLKTGRTPVESGWRN
ncbi:MAG: hypothetical protein RJB38_1787 [Pseudomonadota bacterium]|jgi:hypothetical protein